MATKGGVAVKVEVRAVETVVNAETKIVALDATNAGELITMFEANKASKALLEKEYESLQEQIYTLLGYKKLGKKWIGSAEEGTLGGVAVVKVGTQTRNTFDREAFVQANPAMLDEVEKFTTPSTNTVLKTVR